MRKIFLAVLLTAMGACGDSRESVDSPTVAVDTPTASEIQSEIETTQSPDIGEADVAVEPVLDAVEESDADNVAEPVEKIELAAAEPVAEKPARTDWKYSADQHYIALTAAQGTSSAPDKIEVAEVFWYGCSHCYNFDPIIQNWSDQLPSDVSFIRLPVMWNPTNEIHARIFYVADAVGKLDDMHDEIFKAIHINKNMLTNEAEVEELFAQFEVSGEDFSSAFNRSPSVEKNISRARNLTKRYRVSSVPVLVVNGKFVVTGPGIKNFNDMIAVAEELVERERQER